MMQSGTVRRSGFFFGRGGGIGSQWVGRNVRARGTAEHPTGKLQLSVFPDCLLQISSKGAGQDVNFRLPKIFSRLFYFQTYTQLRTCAQLNPLRMRHRHCHLVTNAEGDRTSLFVRNTPKTGVANFYLSAFHVCVQHLQGCHTLYASLFCFQCKICPSSMHSKFQDTKLKDDGLTQKCGLHPHSSFTNTPASQKYLPFVPHA